MKNSKFTALICSLIAVSATVIFYLLAYDTIFRIPMRWVSLTFLLVAECIGTIKALLVRKSIIAYSSVLASGIHLIAVILLSLLFVNVLPVLIRTYVLLNILLICALAIIDLFLAHFGKTLSSSNKTLKTSQDTMNACYIEAHKLVVLYEKGAYGKDLIDIAELIKYSDNSDLTGDESVIISKLEELASELQKDGEKITSLVSEIKNIIKIRTEKIKNIKRGGH